MAPTEAVPAELVADKGYQEAASRGRAFLFVNYRDDTWRSSFSSTTIAGAGFVVDTVTAEPT